VEEIKQYEYEKKKFSNYLGGLYDYLKSYNAIVAGGSITSIFSNREINDVDVYFRSKDDLYGFLYEVGKDKFILAKTEKALLFVYDGLKVQTIFFKYFETIEQLFNTFDFTVCMGAYDFTTEEFVLHKDFLKHNSQRVLKFNPETAYPIISEMRVQKYADKGYYISRTERVKILLTICDLEIDSYDTLKEQCGGMYGESFDELIQPDCKEDFSIKKAVSKIEEVQNECVVFEKSENIGCIDSWIKYVCVLLGINEQEKKEDIWKEEVQKENIFSDGPF